MESCHAYVELGENEMSVWGRCLRDLHAKVARQLWIKSGVVRAIRSGMKQFGGGGNANENGWPKGGIQGGGGGHVGGGIQAGGMMRGGNMGGGNMSGSNMSDSNMSGSNMSGSNMGGGGATFAATGNVGAETFDLGLTPFVEDFDGFGGVTMGAGGMQWLAKDEQEGEILRW